MAADDGDALYGQPNKHDPNFRGPVVKRSCTDIVCCILFSLFILGYVAVGIVAWVHGDPRQVIHPVDSYGHFCGQPGSPNAEKPYLFYFDILKCASPATLLNLQCLTTQICVKRCPEKFDSLLAAVATPGGMSSYAEFCVPGFTVGQALSPADILAKRQCPSIIFPSQPFQGRCFPRLVTERSEVSVAGNRSINYGNGQLLNATDIQKGAKGISKFMDARQVGMKVFEDFARSWYWILIGLGIALLLSLLFLVLLRFLAGVIVWVMLVALVAIVGYGIYHCYWEYSVNLKGRPGADNKITDLGFQTDLRVYLQVRDTWLAIMILLCILEVVILLLVVFLRKRILIAIALIKESSKAIGHMMSSLLFPIVTFVLLAVVISYWAITSLYLATSGVAVYKAVVPGGPNSSGEACASLNGTHCSPETFNISAAFAACPSASCIFTSFGGEDLYHRNIFNLQVYNVFAFFWAMNFVIALGHCTLAGAFASYYWAPSKPGDIPPCPVFSSFGRTLRYHTGSLAFGSLILAIVQLIRVMLEYIDHKLRVSENKCARFVMCCLKCCFWCLEKFIKFLNRNAYIMVAIYGKNFCVSAKNAFFLLMRNIVRVVVLDKVTDFLLMMGKLLVVGAVGVLAFFFFSGRISFIPTHPVLNYYWVPILTVVVGSYMVAHGFFSVYSMCVDTLFLCFCEDLERNDGSLERPYLMSPGLLQLLGKPGATLAQESSD
ncbi:choline transporter-like protein 2 isoform X1 [Lethenteron reissneri]|uniref:choline transporter-like protein 2 isoform X1 n=1 Tax=Lethenteron reissneri TaxID=7753 RepID=UPI002AB756E6|nr:choline transporter-like protein 2 isoform X1 [Lethenteron reissneri]